MITSFTNLITFKKSSELGDIKPCFNTYIHSTIMHDSRQPANVIIILETIKHVQRFALAN